MKAYSLIAVLAATVLLLVGLVPLLTIQGRLYQKARTAICDPMLQAIQADFQKLQHQSRPLSTSWKIPNYQIQRQVTKKSNSLYRVTYRVSLVANPKRAWVFQRDWYHS